MTESKFENNEEPFKSFIRFIDELSSRSIGALLIKENVLIHSNQYFRQCFTTTPLKHLRLKTVNHVEGGKSITVLLFFEEL